MEERSARAHLRIWGSRSREAQSPFPVIMKIARSQTSVFFAAHARKILNVALRLLTQKRNGTIKFVHTYQLSWLQRIGTYFQFCNFDRYQRPQGRHVISR